MICHEFSQPIPLGPIDPYHDHNIELMNPLLILYNYYQIDTLPAPVSLELFYHNHLSMCLAVLLVEYP